MRDVVSIRTNQETKERMKDVARYLGAELGTELSMGQAVEIMAARAAREYERPFYDSRFFSRHTGKGWVMSEEGTAEFAAMVGRAELEAMEHPGLYLKAVQAACHALGFDPDWVEGDLWAELEKRYVSGRGQE